MEETWVLQSLCGKKIPMRLEYVYAAKNKFILFEVIEI